MNNRGSDKFPEPSKEEDAKREELLPGDPVKVTGSGACMWNAPDYDNIMVNQKLMQNVSCHSVGIIIEARQTERLQLCLFNGMCGYINGDYLEKVAAQ